MGARVPHPRPSLGVLAMLPAEVFAGSGSDRRSVVTDLVSDHIELFRQFYEHPSFQQWLSNAVFSVTYDKAPASASPRRRPGGFKGRLVARKDFDAPLPKEVLETFE